MIVPGSSPAPEFLLETFFRIRQASNRSAYRESHALGNHSQEATMVFRLGEERTESYAVRCGRPKTRTKAEQRALNRPISELGARKNLRKTSRREYRDLITIPTNIRILSRAACLTLMCATSEPAPLAQRRQCGASGSEKQATPSVKHVLEPEQSPSNERRDR